MIFLRLKNNKGFTLVEMMVAIAVFSVVMVAAMSALLNVIDANNKARAIKTAINNVNFALEGISKDMRMGTGYECVGGGGCLPEGNTSIRYRSNRADFESGDGGPKKFAYYKFEGIQIFECLERGGLSCINGVYQPITSSEVILDSVKFYVLGDPLSQIPNKEQPRIIITIRGRAGSKAKTETSFDLQTSVSQRIRKTTP